MSAQLTEEPTAEFQKSSTPLHCAWTVYCTERLSGEADFRQSLQRLCTVRTVEEFAYVYGRLKRPTQLQSNTSVYFARDGPDNVPMWEDHLMGGTYQFKRSYVRNGRA